MERQATQGKLHKSKNKKTRKKKTKTQTNSGQNHKEKAPRKATHIQRKEKELSDISVKSIMRAARGEFLGCWKCWKCWECWKIYDFSTLSMFSMLSMLQKEGNAAQDTPSLRTQFAPNTAQGSAQVPQGRNSTAGATAQCRGSAQTPQGRNRHSAGGAHKLHKGETGTVQGERTSSTRVKQHGRGDSTVQKSAQAPQDGKSDSSGKQERGRQALRSCGFGGRCSENL